jgi:hypothetical protein
MDKNSIVMSYMVRYCLEPNGCCRVLVRQIASGEERSFTDLKDATDYIQRQMQGAKEALAH